MTKRAAVDDAPPSPPKRTKKFFVSIDRDAQIQSKRMELPVCMHEQQIMEAVHENDVVLVTGATGTGKTTQVPQFFIEDGFGHPSSPGFKGIIGVTQPRRVAAIACAKRVAFETNSTLGQLIGYQIRHEAKVSSQTRVKFATDGVFLREIEHDLLLSKYSAIIIDEVHERSLNTDLLLSFLSRSVIMRRQKLDVLGALKVIIMSATLDVEGVFSGENALFPNPPVIKVPSRQFPITVHFSKRTKEDYVDEAYQKVSKIHRRLPQGGILVFLSGREEVERLSARLRENFGERKITLPNSDGVQLSMLVLPFYSLQPEPHQRRVFEPTEEVVRKVVVATNIAETSVTVPGIAYVVDSGRVKEKVFKGTGCGRLSKYEIGWVSQASAEQRAGRAGRTGPGHCYRLYSSAVYDQKFAQFRTPEVLRVPADAVVLRLRAMGIRYVHKFPFPTRPHQEELHAAENLLTNLGALHRDDKSGQCIKSLLGVTEVGRELATLPLEPRLARMVLHARDTPSALPHACRLGGILSVGTVFRRGDKRQHEIQAQFRNRRSDLLTEMAALCAVEHSGRHKSCTGELDVFRVKQMCDVVGLHTKCVLEALAVSEQVGKLMGISKLDNVPGPPNGTVINELLRAVVAGFGDRIARKVPQDEAASMGVIPKYMSRAFKVANRKDAVFLNGNSAVRVMGDTEFVVFTELEEVAVLPKDISSKADELREGRDDYIDSEEDDQEDVHVDGVCRSKDAVSMEKQNSGNKRLDAEEMNEVERRVVMRGVSVINRAWISEEAGAMCTLNVKKDEEPRYDVRVGVVMDAVRARYGPEGWAVGWRWVDVEQLAGKLVNGVDEERRSKWCSAFATALLQGAVCENVLFRPTEGRVDVCHRVVTDVLSELEIFSVEGVRRVGHVFVDRVVSTISACCSIKTRERVEMHWRTNLHALIAEEENEKCSDQGEHPIHYPDSEHDD